MIDNTNFERLMEKQLGPQWKVAVTEEALDFYRQIYEAGASAGWVARNKHEETVQALKRLGGVLNEKR